MQPDLFFVSKDLHPGSPIRIRPDRVVSAREIDSDPPTSFLEKIRQEITHFVVGERIFPGPGQLIPLLLRFRQCKGYGDKFVPGRGGCAATGSNTPGKNIEESERSRDLPAAEVAACGAPPDVRCKSRSCISDLSRNFDDLGRRDAALPFGEFRGERSVDLFQASQKIFEAGRRICSFVRHEFPPVRPAADKFTIDQILFQKNTPHCEKDGGF